MNETPDADDDSTVNRRRKERIGFVHPCSVNILSPAWAITKEPLVGETENITDHGLRVNLGVVVRDTAESWQEAVFDDSELEVEVSLPELERLPAIKGQIVWVHCPAEEQEPCSVGVLFSIMTADQSHALHDLISTLQN